MATKRAETGVRPGLPGFLGFCERIGFPIEPFQRKIAAAYFAGARELLVLLPRGNGKSRLVASLALHHILITANPAVYVATSSREQARIVYEYGRDAAIALALDDVVICHLELRVPGGHLRVLASDAPKLHGLTPSLFVIDELQAAKDDSVYLAARTALRSAPLRGWL